MPLEMKGTGRPLVLDHNDSNVATESRQEVDLRLYKTTDRRIYDAATARSCKLYIQSRPITRILLTTD